MFLNKKGYIDVTETNLKRKTSNENLLKNE